MTMLGFETPEVTVIGVTDFPMDTKKRTTSTNCGLISSCDESSTCCNSSLSSSSDASTGPVTKNRRRRRAPRKKKPRNANGSTRSQNSKSSEPQVSLEEQAQYVAMDCEMVGLGKNGFKSSVARVTLVGWDGETIFDEYIRQEAEVTDYRTFVSGITKTELEAAEWTLEECRERLSELLEGKVLVGHALKNDFKALKISHPWQMTRDTAKYEPFQQVRFDDGVLWPRKLKDLVKQKLQREIQVPGQPHSSYEDAAAAMDLYKRARNKWEKAMDYKMKKTQEIEQRNQPLQ